MATSNATGDSDRDESLAARSFSNSRLFDAPRERMFRAWTVAEHLTRWWGPKGFSSTFHEFDPRPGGHWRFLLHGPDGKDYPNHSQFLEVVEPERIVLDHLSAPRFQVTATFEEREGKTFLTFTMLFPTVRERETIQKFAYNANEQNFDRLADELARMA